MKKRLREILMVLAVMISTGVMLMGCSGNKTAEDTSANVEATDETEEDTEEAVADDSTNDATNLEAYDVDNPTKEMQNMFLIMDAINMCMLETGQEYSQEDTGFFWTAIKFAIINSGIIEAGMEGITYDTMSGETTVTPEIVKQFALAIFCTDELPIPPQVENGVSVTADGSYLFGIGDRGLSQGVLHSWDVNDDGTYTVEVELQAVGEDDGREMAKFNYLLTDNYYASDSETPMFAFSIEDVVAADDLTIGMMRGTPYFSMLYQDYGKNLIVELPSFVSLKWTDGLSELNKRISEEIMDCYAYDSDSDEGWAEIKSYPMTSEDYLQVVITAIDYPNYATQGEVYSYVYDIKNECALTNEDGLALAGITEQELYDLVASSYKPTDTSSFYNHAELGGFRIKDGNVDFYLKLFIDNDEADNYNQIATYSMKSGKLLLHDGGVLIPDTEIDVMTPPLTHGAVG